MLSWVDFFSGVSRKKAGAKNCRVSVSRFSPLSQIGRIKFFILPAVHY